MTIPPHPATFIPLAEFQALTGLTDQALLHLLRENRLPVSASAAGLLVDTGAAELPLLVEALRTAHDRALQERESLLIEEVGQIINGELDEIIAEALAILAEGDHS